MTKLGIFVGEDMWMFFEEIYRDLASDHVTDIFVRKTYGTPILNGRLNQWAFRKGILSTLRRNDVCFFEWASEFLMVASHMPKQCAIITRLHSFELYDWAPRVNWNAVDRVIVLSSAMQQMFCELYPNHADKTTIIHNGRSLEEFKPPVQREFGFKLGMLCAIDPVKRVYEVILMLSQLREAGFHAHLSIAGAPKGDLRYAAAVYRLVERLGLEDCVTFDGYVTNTTAWLQEIDIFISNSFWEGQQVALLEAMACGCYCLSHAWAGAEEMLPSANLYFMENELKNKIIEYSRMSQAERKYWQLQLRSIACDKFDIEQTKQGIRKVIEEAYICTKSEGEVVV